MATRRKEDRCKRAQERQEIQTNRTPLEQLKRLDEMFGEGKGAVKERTRLTQTLTQALVIPSKVAAPSPELYNGDTNVSPELIAKVNRFSEKYMDNKNVHSIGLGVGKNGLVIRVIAARPKKAELPEEFEDLEVVVVKGGLPKPA
jgi:hypothetical protein